MQNPRAVALFPMTNVVQLLEEKTGGNWAHLTSARIAAEKKMEVLTDALAPFDVPDTSLVVFGSLARLEFTSESDIDWTLLLDGFSAPEHLDTARAIAKKLDELKDKGPGKEATFGTLAPSHDLIHYIGGEDDTNSNTTRRTLLLLESRPLLNREAYDRVRHNLLKRYLSEDLGLWRKSNPYKIPHFLLNDFARYWRTMTVDFAYKQRSRGNDGFALRNIKLRMSRKLIYIAGMLACFECHLSHESDEVRAMLYKRENVVQVLASMRQTFEQSPLEVVASALIRYDALLPSARNFFDSYNEFVGLLADKEKRDRLSALTPEQLEADSTYREARNISHVFREAISQIFLTATNPIGDLTIRFGVF
jgi:predicted nucleotidyltransferase